MNSPQTIPFSRKSTATRQQARRLLPVPCGKAPDGCYKTHFGQKIAGFFGFWGTTKLEKRMCELWEAQVRRQLWHKVWVLLYKLYPFHAGGLYKKTTTYSSSNPGSMRGSLRDTHTQTHRQKGRVSIAQGMGERGGRDGARRWRAVPQSDSGSPWTASRTGRAH